MSGSDEDRVRPEPAAGDAGWVAFDVADHEGFNARVLGPLRVRQEAAMVARVRMVPGIQTRNVFGRLHGGALLGFLDVSLFAALQTITGRGPAAAVTLDLTTQFLAPGTIDRPVEAVVELLRETGRLAFLRGTAEQDGTMIGAFQATVRKLGAPG